MSEKNLPPLARSELERDYLARLRPELFDELWAEPSTRVLAMYDSRVLATNTPTLKLFETNQVPSANLRVYLGRAKAESEFVSMGGAIVLAVLNENSAKQLESDDSKWLALRSIGGFLSALDAGIFTQSLALANWHQSHQHCPGCGTPTVIEQGGWVRRCLKDDRELYPRLDPAIIVAIIDDRDRILLGSQRSWDEKRWSVLAGFVEPGESLEAAVIREMREESGLEVSNPQYIFSQSWPYPLSLMLGFVARAASEQPLSPDGDEIARLQWFTRERLSEQASQMLLPNYSTISRALIEHWYGAKLESLSENQNGSP